jgi:hypothetical protein
MVDGYGGAHAQYYTLSVCVNVGISTTQLLVVSLAAAFIYFLFLIPAECNAKL